MQSGIFVRDVCIFDKSRVHKNQYTNEYEAPIYTVDEGTVWYTITINNEIYETKIAPMPSIPKHVVFSGYLYDVPLMRDYVGMVNEARQRIQIVSFMALNSDIHVPDGFKRTAISTIVPYVFDAGPEEGAYVVHLNKPVQFKPAVQIEDDMDDDEIDQGDILNMDEPMEPSTGIVVSTFDKEILGLDPQSRKGKEVMRPIPKQRSALESGSKKGSPSKQRSTSTLVSSSKKGSGSKEISMSVLATTSQGIEGTTQDIQAQESATPQDAKTRQALQTKLGSSTATEIQSGKKTRAVIKKAAATIEVNKVEAQGRHEVQLEEITSGSGNSSSADYEGLVEDMGSIEIADVESSSVAENLKRVRSDNTVVSSKMTKKKMKVIEFMQTLAERKKKKQ